jgi:hypothetical protein
VEIALVKSLKIDCTLKIKRNADIFFFRTFYVTLLIGAFLCSGIKHLRNECRLPRCKPVSRYRKSPGTKQV